ncbi:tetratricopeptide repeat protein, partial [Umezawaea tangerina]
LLQQHEFGYYTFHDLVRSFVRQILKNSDHADAADVPNAVKGLLDYLVHTSDHVCDLLFSGRVRLPTGVTDPPPIPSQLRDHKNARVWLARERTTLEAAAVLAHERGFDRHAAHLTRNVVFQLDTIGLYTEFAEITQLSVLSSRRLGDRELLHLSLSNSAVANWKLGRFEAGIKAASEALEIARDLDDRRGFAKGIGMLGLLTTHTGQFDEALPMLQESIRIKRELGVGRAEAESLVNLSSLYEEWGRYPEAVEAASRAVALDNEFHIRGQQIIACVSLAQAHLGMHDHDKADHQLDVARALVEEFGAPAGNAALVFALSALTHYRLGRDELADQYADLALRNHRGHWTTTRQVEIDNIIGRLRRAQGRHTDALTHHLTAYEVASAIGYRIAEARALAGLSEAENALGRTEAAREHLREANATFADMGVPPAARG